MFWNQLFNQPFNHSLVPVTLVEDDISFNGFGLLNSVIRVFWFNPEDAGVVNYRDFPLPENDGSWFISRRWVKKEIVMRGNIRGTDKDDAEAQLDIFKKNLQGTEGTLKYTTQGQTREITATCTRISIPRKPHHINVIPFEISFSSTDEAWRNTANQSALYSAVTSNLAEEITCEGSKDSYPVIYIWFRTGLSWVTTISFWCNDRELTISETIADEDLIIMDCKRKRVTLNGTAIDYTGTFPKFIVGPNYFNLDINGTFTADVTFIYAENYL